MKSKVAEIKRKIAQGTYEVDPAAVADAMLNRRIVYNKNRALSDDQRSLILALDYAKVNHLAIASAAGCSVASVERIIGEHDRTPVFHRSRN